MPIISQTAIIDSLEHALQKASGEEAISILQKLSWDLKFKDPERALTYANKGMRQTDLSIKDEGIFLKNIAVVHSIKGKLDTSDEFCQKAIDAFKKADNLRLEGTCWSLLGSNCRKRGDYECAPNSI